MTDITFHYPPELFNLLVDAIPALNRGTSWSFSVEEAFQMT